MAEDNRRLSLDLRSWLSELRDGRVDYLAGSAARPEQTAAAVRAIVATQRALASDPALAVEASGRHFPVRERALIAELVRRDAPFYDPAIPVAKVEALNRFARDTGILDRDDIAYEEVATQFAPLWGG